MGGFARKKDTGEPGNGGQFGHANRRGSGLTLPPARQEDAEAARERRMRRADELAATSKDEGTQMWFARNGETAQRDAVLKNPHLGEAVIEWLVENTRFNPVFSEEFAAHPNMTPELRRRIRTWD